ncbi:hypothetical protein MCOR27_008714 [Pyricularia oryzae]|uniref:BZIP domain-containing protein n=5 Tax=Pyricularia TaxID=48558 RepID=A0ABQ8NKB8_PYRGI|nr:uncharacterized protein MGG_00342 [Pyricularia oryzae 70-15]KAH8841113.1 hypothetical protein MCOR01_007781 [Pyricularia oryzae]KAI6298426.1 hypothetical protein MCOR33_005411 [Pyricularia grisea]EHA49156.1 hypothetical protein MGG_00342 [Pyricularia oryzae 70-15]KAH9433566.1 hypothetical protein MCOR02_005614 [Pyricularia oryzae]KAI6253742.1 hypothetical protein MCOR19_009720 [Pyricularia oryzae]
MQSYEGSGGSDGGHDKSPLSSIPSNFLRNLTDKRTKSDAPAPKRRGPKPDSKPALTRRQELNRQAQRTHRERKELYIKALEDEVLRLKETYSNVSQAKDNLSNENRQLKQLLAQNGISFGGAMGIASGMMDDGSIDYASSSATGSGYGGGPASSHTSAFTPSPLASDTANSQQYSRTPTGHGSLSPHPGGHHQHTNAQHHPRHGAQPLNNPGVDYEQAGIDFVLALEKPCMDHLPWLLERGTETGGEACGHALMASCPPEPFSELTPDIPFGYSNVKNGELDSGQRTWELSKGDLNTLLDLSKRLNLDGEITPVMAWGMVLAHPRLGEMTPKDFKKLTEELCGKVRCYGFGAVMEEFEARDAIENVFSTKPDSFHQSYSTEYGGGR